MALMFEDQMVPDMQMIGGELSPSELRHLAADVCLKPPLSPLKSASLEKVIMNVLETQPLTPTHWMETERDACIMDLLSEDTPIIPKATVSSQKLPISPLLLPHDMIEASQTTKSNTVNKSQEHETTTLYNKGKKTNNTAELQQHPKTTPKSKSTPVLPFITGKRTLPPTHKPARGRGRRQQLKMMTEEQKEEEARERAAKNRLAAKECRLRRKGRETQLKERVAELEAQLLQSQQTVFRLKNRVTELEAR